MSCCSNKAKCACKVTEGQIQAVVLRTGGSIYSPWIPRGGDYLRATAELVARNFKNLTVKLFTRDEDEVGNGVEVDATTTIVISSVGRAMQEWGSNTGTGLKQLVRYQFSITPLPQVSPAEFIAFRMLMPCWFDAVLTSPLP
jgi:hypothetical protein